MEEIGIGFSVPILLSPSSLRDLRGRTSLPPWLPFDNGGVSVRTKVTAVDVALVIVGIAAVAASAAFAYGRGGEPRVVIETKTESWIYPLDRDRTVDVPGPLGSTVVRVGHGAAYVESSPCDNQTCVAAGRVSKPGQWTACLPNGVMVRVEGGGDDGAPDAIVR